MTAVLAAFVTGARRHALDLCCALTLAAGAIYCAWAWQDAALARGEAPDFYQFDYAPAVMVACGHGLQNVPPGAASALDAFLALRTDRLDCRDLPPQLPSIRQSALQRMTPYLQWVVGEVWKFSGPSWRSARVLSTLWCGLVAVLLYAIFRLILPAVPSWVCAAIFTLSPVHLSQVWRLRDYSKAPFMLGVLLLIGLLLRPGTPSRRRQLLLAVSAGLVIGLGLGFRSDLQLAIVVFVGAVALAFPGGLRDRALVIGAALLTTVIVGAPAIAGLAGGSNSGHVAILGWAPEFDRRLGVRAASYEPMPLYLDSAAYLSVLSWVARTRGGAEPVDTGSSGYDRMTSLYIASVVRRLPADVATRVLAAIADRLEAPFANGLEIWIPRPPAASTARIFALPLALSRGAIGLASAVLLAFALILWRPWLFAAAVWIGGALLGGAALQYSPRHAFYLEFVPVWCLAAAFVVGFRVWREATPLRTLGRRAGMLIALVVIGAATFAGLRQWQSRAMGEVLDVLRATPLEAFPLLARPYTDKTVLLDAPADLLSPANSSGSALLRVELSDQCASVRPVVGVRYTFERIAADPSRTYEIQFTSSNHAALVVPVYRRRVPLPTGFSDVEFAGLEMTPQDVRCVTRWGRIQPPPDVEPWFVATLEAARPTTFQRFEREPADPDQTTAYVSDSVARATLLGPLYPSTWKVVDATIARPGVDGAVEVSGVPGAFTYLLQGPQAVRAGSPVAIVRGVLRTGALSVGLVGGGRWLTEISVSEPGRFAVAIPRVGESTLVVASGVDGPSPLDATIADAGWAVGSQFTTWAWPADVGAPPPAQPDDDRTPLRPLPPNATISSGVLQVDGIGPGKYSYVAETDPAPRRAGAIVVVRGEVQSGGLTVGLQSAGAWVASLNIDETGPFVATLRVPGDATYSVIIARDARDAGDRVRGRIDAVSWQSIIDSTTVTR